MGGRSQTIQGYREQQSDKPDLLIHKRRSPAGWRLRILGVQDEYGEDDEASCGYKQGDMIRQTAIKY